MKSQKYPYITIAISIVTIVYSLYVNVQISGSFFGKIKYVELEPYGGVTFSHLWNLELWRIFVSQIIHFKQPHMLFNVLSFALLGLILEKYIGSIRFFILWLLSGTFGTLISTLTVEPPWNIGTGASQAVFGVSALGILVIWKKIDTSFLFKFIVGFALIPALLLDLVYAHHPKLGHIVGFITGLAIGLYYLNKHKITHGSN
ncbi:rhomboid family intramembrane serine protease [Desulfospira joergensenii]|uniref:rhomboid family intramembrane serine protease n=1 Tax=Desulfospira joergensenii TaxID=53329 RepID=UPI0003B45A3E|nr:rhomboid family intramembrane serine protease [Desulfospira joergensenii]